MAPERPKLLFLSRSFPPATAVAHIRGWNIAKYLSRLHWDVTVVTPLPAVWRQVEDSPDLEERLEREGIRRILTEHRWRFLMPDQLKCRNTGPWWLAGGTCRTVARRLGVDNGIGWVSAAREACSSLSPADVDLILATASPFSAFSFARRLSEKLGRPYVMDYRDPWSGNPHRKRRAGRRALAEEQRLLDGSSAVTVVSQSWADNLDRRFKLGSKLKVITNGYDPEELSKVDATGFDHFAIVYTGAFYPPKRVITPLVSALGMLRPDPTHRPWRLHYYGSQGAHVLEESRRSGVEDRVVVHGRVSRREALSAVKGAGLAAVITSVDSRGEPEDRGMVPSKIYEAFGLRTPVLLISPPDGDAAAILRREGTGHVFSGDQIEGIRNAIAEAISREPAKPPSAEAYSWRNLSLSLDGVLRAAMGATRTEHAGAVHGSRA